MVVSNEHTRFIHIVIFAMLFMTSLAFCQYTITSFETGMRTIPPSGNDVIIPFEGTTLKQVTIVPELKPGEVLLRRRFSATEYGLFIGKMSEKAYSRLSAFRVKGFTLSDAVTHKFYGTEATNPDQDISNMYFDNDLVYMVNAARLFYFDKDWQQVTMESQLPARLTITSKPSGADVYIDGIRKGITPYEAGAVFSPSVVVQIQKEDYYIQENFINLEGKAQVTKNFTLSKKRSFENDSGINVDALTAENTESIDEIDQRITVIENKIEVQKTDSMKAVAGFERSYPSFQPQGEFEKPSDFQERETKYQEQKNIEKEQIGFSSGNTIKRLTQAEEKVRIYKEIVENRSNQRYFTTDSINLETFKPDSEYFPVSIHIKDGYFDFSFSGKLFVPIDIAPAIKEKLSDGRLSLFYKNKIIEVAVNGAMVKRLFDFAELRLKFKEKEYPLTGKFELPEYVTSGSAWKEYTANQEKIAQQKILRVKTMQEKMAQANVHNTDIDGNVYHTITIGIQTWMAENLKTTKYNDGTAIPMVMDGTEWGNLTAPGYCWYNNDASTYKNTYGALYNWYAVDTKKLAPAGWHVPSDAEWDTLQNYLIVHGYNWEGTITDNEVAKSIASQKDWPITTRAGTIGSNLAMNNKSGFSAFPGGTRTNNGSFSGIGCSGYWWSATVYNKSNAYDRALFYDKDGFYRYHTRKWCGFSVRLIKD